jgi:drug/metabolite transporter (DMT)-like permease
LNLFYAISITVNSLALASVLLATAPGFTIFISALLFREKITGPKIRALILVFAGAVLTSGIIGTGFNGVNIEASGVVVGLIGGLGWAVYGITTRLAMNKGYKTLTVNLYTFGVGAALCVPFTEFTLLSTITFVAPIQMALFFTAHALVAALLPYVLYNYGLRFVETGTASILAAIDPVCASVIGILFYDEIPDCFVLLGIALVLFGIGALQQAIRVDALPPKTA